MRACTLLLLLGWLAAPSALSDDPPGDQEDNLTSQSAEKSEAEARRERKEAEKARRRAKRTKCSCTTWPFSPDPPCFDHCATRAITTADESVLAEVLDLSPDERALLAAVREEHRESSSSVLGNLARLSKKKSRNKPVLDVTDERVVALMDRIRALDAENAAAITEQFEPPNLFK